MNDRQRDQAIEGLLRETATPEVRVSSACLDAELLAAWFEGTLASQQRAVAEAHIAGCARCESMLAAMVRMQPEVATASGRSWRSWMVMLSPAMAAAAALLLWFAVDRRATQSEIVPAAVVQPSSSGARTMPNSAPAAQAPDVSSRIEPDTASARAKSVNARDLAKDAPLADKVKKEVDEKRLGRREAERQMAAAAEAKPDSQRSFSAATPPVTLRSPPPPPAPVEPLRSPQQVAADLPAVAPVPAPAAVPVQAGQTAAAAAPKQQMDQIAPAGRSGLGGGYVGRVGGARTDAASANELIAIPGANFEVVSPASAVRWRIVDGHTITQSADSGSTWSTQYTADAALTFIAGAAPSPTVCWLVGRRGLVFVTADGRAWRRLTFPEAVDLASVTATDARTAVVTTADRRVFTTADGGVTWSLRRN